MEFEKIGEITICRFEGKVTLDQMVERVLEAIVEARGQGVRKLMLVTAGLTGFPRPSVADRYHFITKWAEAAGGMRVAMVTVPERIDPQRFGVVVAENLGVTSNVFVTEEEALDWLKGMG